MSNPGAASSSSGNSQLVSTLAPLQTGDQLVISQDTSPFREGSSSIPNSGQLQALVGDLVMKYWSHNVGLDANGNFIGRDDAGPCAIITFSEGIGANAPIYSMYSCPNGTAGSLPGAFTKVYSIDLTTGAIGFSGSSPSNPSTGWGTPTGGSVVNNFPGATATLLQTSTAVAQLIAVFKGFGFLGT